MIRDLRFDELERADRRRRLTRIVVACVVLSSAVSFVAARELKIRQEYSALPEASLGDIASLRARHDGISGMLTQHHVWLGAFQARTELDDLTQSIATQERTLAALEQQRSEEEQRIREEAEAARARGLVLAERKDYAAALVQLRRALELCDSLGESAWDGGAWQHRDQVVIDIYALENLDSESK